MRRLLPVLAAAAALLGAGAAEARTVVEEAVRGDTRAELSYERTGDEFNTSYDAFRLRIYEGGELVLDRPLATCGRRCRRYAPAGYGRLRSVLVRDLNGGRPEVVVDFDTGGGYCCWLTVVHRPTGDGYARSTKSWGPKRQLLEDVGGGATPEFVSFDDRLLAPYGCGSCWRSLEHVWRFGSDGRFRDVTRRFPARVRPSSRGLRRAYFRASARGGDVKPVLAAYVATTYLLRTPRTGWRLVKRAHERGELVRRRGRYDFCPCGRGWIDRLRRFLGRTGYR